jgi:hypothetical protein
MDDNARKLSFAQRYRRLTPWNKVGFWGSIASLFAIPLAVYFYVESQRARKLAWAEQGIRTIVFDPLDTTSFTVSHGDSVIKDRIMAVNVAVWNAGNEAIRTDNVLENVSLSLDPPGEVLEARIRQTKRDVSHFSVGREGWERGNVPLSWKILEDGDGAVIQVIYVGEKFATVKLNGTIEGQRSFINSMGTTLPIIGAPRLLNVAVLVVVGVMGLFCEVGVLLSFFIGKDGRDFRQRSPRRYWFAMTYFLLTNCIVAWISYDFLKSHFNVSPFGP